MIQEPTEMNFENKTFSALLYGPPGIGKTTLALSAPNPILIDFDRGVSRVKAYHRRLTIMSDTYEEVLDDLASPKVKACETLIIDTGGSFITFLQDWAMRDNPVLNKQKNGAISLKGFGAVKAEFARFTAHVKYVMNKNVIYVFHSVEEKDKDGNPIQRLLCEGAARNIVWQPCDFGGFIQMIGNKRTISFTPEQEFFAKGCHGIEGRHDIPKLGVNDKNDFMTRIFEHARANIAAESEAFSDVKEEYDRLMEEVREVIDNCENADDCNAAADAIPGLDHVLTSKKELAKLLNEKAAALGLIWDKDTKKYVPEAALEATTQQEPKEAAPKAAPKAAQKSSSKPAAKAPAKAAPKSKRGGK